MWLKLWFKNGVSIKKLPQALFITLTSLLLSPVHLLNEIIIYFKSKSYRPGPDPIFIIGHWRSGTTFLQYLMSHDENLGYLTYYQAFVPTLTFAGGKFFKKLLSPLIPSRRPQDDVYLHADLPTEEENSLATISTRSASQSFFFPNNEEYYNRYILFQHLSAEEKSNWKKAYRRMINQIGIRWPGKRLLIKNPHNTGRLLELKEIYPNAKFIFLHRNPLDCFPSTYLMYDKVVKTQYLHNYTTEDTNNKIFYYYKTIVKRYLDQRDYIPRKDLFEIAYDDLLSDPLSIIKNLYRHLELKLEDHDLNKMKDFVDAQKSYRINTHELNPELRSRITKELKFVFSNFKYPIN